MIPVSARTVVECFRAVAARQPSRTAIGAGHGFVTYAELESRSDRIAMMLAARGVGPGHRVGLYAEREPRLLVALLGILKSGAGVVPLLSSLPLDRLRTMARATDITLAIAAGDAAVPPDFGFATVAMDACERYDGETGLPAIDPDGLASILFTSGTTGHPKGIPQSHRLMLDKLHRNSQVFQYRQTDRVTAFSTPAMSQGLGPVLMTLLAGATVCPFDIRNDGVARLTAWMDGQQLTVWWASVTLLRTLARSVEPDRQFSGIRLVRMGGERILSTDVAAARRLFPSAEIFLTYGTSETGSISTYRVGDAETCRDGVATVGVPHPDIVVRIVDDRGADVPPGDEGEIVVQSASLAPGYWRDPELSAARFADAPGSPAVRLYRTGDVGRWRPDGLLEHLGRKDLRVKIRGYRIEIEEVEAVLTQHPEIVRAAVAARPDAEGDLRLVAYVQASGSELTVEALRVELARRLADYMIPSTFVFVDEIPLTASGKIARQLLPEPPPDRPELQSEYERPRNAREETIAAVWREVLGVTRVGIHDGFFSVGGDSLKATLVASRLNARLGLSVPLATLFDASTIAELSAAIERLDAEPGNRL